MKKLIFSTVLVAALVCSTCVMAQDVKKSEPAKVKTEAKAATKEVKATATEAAKTVKADAKATTTQATKTVKTEAKAVKAEAKKEDKKLTPVKSEQPAKQTTTPKAK